MSHFTLVRKSNYISKVLQTHTWGKVLTSYVSSRCNSASTTNHYDIIIAGGGMVGTALACSLGKSKKLSDKRILLLEANKKFEFRYQDQYRLRVSALSPSTKSLLQKIGVWNHIEKSRFGVVKKMQVWDGISDVMITFNNSDLSEIIAYIVENDVVLAAIDEELKSLSNVTIVNEARIKEYTLPLTDSCQSKIEMENGSSYDCDLLLGCDGANSKVRDTMGVKYVHGNYNQKGIVATVRLSEESENVVAWQRFIPTGPIALLPLDNNHSSLVWSTTKERAEELLKLSNEQFVDALNEAVWKKYDCSSCVNSATVQFNKFLEWLQLPSNTIRQLPPSVIEIDGPRAAFPLGFGHATNYVGKGVALVGDAAHRVHPLAGQGVNLGFGDVATLEKILSEAVYSGSNIGSLLHLREYESERQKHNVPMMMAIHGLQTINSTEFAPIVLLRSLGLQFTHAVNPLKRAIIGFAGN